MKLPRKLIFRSSRKTAGRILLAIAVLQLTGCVVGPKYHTPAVQAPPAYKEVGDWKPAQPNDQNLGGTWWTIFQDPQLDALEDAGQCIESESEGRRGAVSSRREQSCATIGPTTTQP